MKKKILIVSSEFPPGPGGIGTHAYSLAKSLAMNQYNVCVLTLSDYVSKKERSQFDKNQKDLKIYRQSNLLKGIDQIARIVKYLILVKCFKPNVIFYTGRFGLYCSLFSISRKFIQIKIVHGSEINPNGRIEKFINQLSIRKSYKIVAVSEFTRRLITDNIKKINFADIVVIHNGLLNALLEKWKVKREIEDFNSDVLNLLTVGNVIPRKGQQNVIHALPKLITKYPNLTYDIVGAPCNKKSLMHLAKTLSILENIKFHGRVTDFSDLDKYYNSADIFFILSENLEDGDVEGYGIVVLEANYFGIPVIGSVGTGIESAVQNHYNGILVDPKNPEEILQSVNEIIDNYEQYKVNSIKWAQKNNWDNLVNQYIKIIE
jgi:phosphatidylinositol alpha-1,6-mannosyltransferase